MLASLAVTALLRCSPLAWGQDDEITVEAPPSQPPEPGQVVLTTDILRELPGSAGDAIRAIQNLPGVGRTPLGLGQLVIRGLGPEDSRYSLDGLDVPLVFHFAGVTTLVPTDALSDVTFLPGGYGVRYGRSLGGRVDLRSADVIPADQRGRVALDAFQGSLWAELRASDRTGVWISLRRSWIDTALTPLLSNEQVKRRFPRYFDGWMRVLHKVPGVGTFDAAVVVSDDRASTGLRDEDGVYRPINVYSLSFQRVRLRWQGAPSLRWRPELAIQLGPDAQVFVDGAEELAREERLSVDGRAEVLGETDSGDRLRMGVDFVAGTESWRYAGDGFVPEEAGAAPRFAPGLYVEPTWRRGPVEVTAGLRADLHHVGRTHTTWSVDPRASAQWTLPRGVTLLATVGRYSQPPRVRQVSPEGDGTATLRPPWALQTSLGLRWALDWGVELTATGFVTPLFGLIVGREDRFQFLPAGLFNGPIDTAPYANAGRGLAGGFELLARAERPRWRAWLSMTLQRSWRTGRDGGRATPSQWDQPWLINALGSVKLPKRWMVGARVRASAGTPYTPVTQRLHDLDSRLFLPLFGDVGSARLPTFFSLDLRVDKVWELRGAAVTLYLDLWNVTNTRNVEVIGWTWDYGAERGILGLPIVPAFGLAVEW